MCCSVLWRADMNWAELCWSCAREHKPLFSINAAAIFRQLFPYALDEIDFHNLLLLFSRHLVFVFVETKIAVYTVYQKWFDWHTHAATANTMAKLCVFAFLFVIQNRHLFHWVTNANEYSDTAVQCTYTINTLHMPYTTRHDSDDTHTHTLCEKKWQNEWHNETKPFSINGMYSQSLRFILT